METLERFRMPQKLPFSKKKLPRRIILSYILDYVILIILLIAVTALNAVGPFHQHFALQNYTIQHPFAVHEKVPAALLYFLAVVCPAAIIAVYTLAIDGIFSHHKQASAQKTDGRRALSGQYRFKDRLWELNCGILGLLTSNVAAYTITGVLKNATGKPRPDFIDRCRPLQGSVDPPVFGLSNITICTQSDHGILKDGFKSFPSGHCSTSFAGLFFLSLYLAGKLHILDNRGESWKSLVVLIPTLGAALIAISRIEDARHHPFDALFGSLLGAVTAWYAYRQYFPPLSETWRKGRAYPIRSWAGEPMVPNGNMGSHRDEGVEPLRVAPPATDEEQPRPTTATGAYRTEPSLDNLTEPDVRHRSNPFTPVGRGGRPMRTDGYWSSSSSDHEEDEEGFQLQNQHPMTDPQSHQPSRLHDRYDTVAEGFSADTTYHPQNQSANHDPTSVVPSQV